LIKKVLILCTGNSCRSIMAEGMINALLEGFEASSAGVEASGKVNANAREMLELNNAWRDEYHSKSLDEVIDTDFDLVVTVCDHAKETCPIFPKPVPKIHVGFEDPDGKEFSAFEELWEEMRERLLPEVKRGLK
jgi:arsenate reductase